MAKRRLLEERLAVRRVVGNCRPMKCWMLGLCFLFCLGILYLTGVRPDVYYQTFLPAITGEELLPTTFVLDTPGCQIPAFDPFNSRVIRRYMSQEKPLDCAGKHPVLVESNLTALYLVKTALPAYRVTDIDSLECCYRPFWRVAGDPNNYSLGVDDKVRFSPNCTVFRWEAVISDEFVAVTCSVGRQIVYRDYHFFFSVKTAVEERLGGARRQSEALSVVMVGLDSVSRLNLHRQMPRTVAQLVEMDAIEMLGYNKVGENTFPFMVAALGGRSEPELKAVCWPNRSVSLDNCPWIWNNFSSIGYRTAFGEDAPTIGAFNYHKVGFVKQPTDYYMRPYSNISEGNVGHGEGHCTGARVTMEVLLRYVSKFALTLSSLLTFGLFWSSSLSHDSPTYPSQGDEAHKNFLWDLDASGALNNTAFLYLSDHGMRFGKFVETYQGRLEDRLPFLFFVFPRWFRERYTLAVSNLETNARRLITAFDLHATLLDFLDLGRLEDDAIRRRTRDELQPPPRGISLFLPVPENRTCSDAGIDPHWCTCRKSQPLSTSSLEARTMAHVLLDHLNTMLRPHRDCAQLQLAEIKDANFKLPQENLQDIKDYDMLVRTTPGDALFEATIRHLPIDNTNAVMGSVSRVNEYGEQSACINDFHMKLYCFCRRFLIF